MGKATNTKTIADANLRGHDHLLDDVVALIRTQLKAFAKKHDMSIDDIVWTLTAEAHTSPLGNIKWKVAPSKDP